MVYWSQFWNIAARRARLCGCPTSGTTIHGEVPVGGLLGEEAGVLEVHGLDVEGQVSHKKSRGSFEAIKLLLFFEAKSLDFI